MTRKYLVLAYTRRRRRFRIPNRKTAARGLSPGGIASPCRTNDAADSGRPCPPRTAPEARRPRRPPRTERCRGQSGPEPGGRRRYAGARSCAAEARTARSRAGTHRQAAFFRGIDRRRDGSRDRCLIGDRQAGMGPCERVALSRIDRRSGWRSRSHTSGRRTCSDGSARSARSLPRSTIRNRAAHGRGHDRRGRPVPGDGIRRGPADRRVLPHAPATRS